MLAVQQIGFADWRCRSFAAARPSFLRNGDEHKTSNEKARKTAQAPQLPQLHHRRLGLK
jgi:hypothetical protein